MKHRFIANSESGGVFTIGPEEAKFYLDNYNTHNRPLRKITVNKYVEEIEENKWVVTSNGIGFDKNGVLTDGQHRLQAVVEANKPVRFLIGFGLEEKAAQLKTDRGKGRTHMENIQLSGQSIDRVMYKVAYNMCREDNNWGWSQPDVRVDKYIENNRELLEKISNIVFKPDCLASFRRVGFLTAMAHYYLKDEAKADAFLKEVTKEGIARSPVADAARTYLLQVKRSNGSQAREDYEKAVRFIHHYHLGLPMFKRLRSQKAWDF